MSGGADGLRGQAAPDASEGDAESDEGEVVVSPLPTAGTECMPVITGTLSTTTDQDGRARFEHLGEGNWILRFAGEVTQEGLTAAIVPLSVQGIFPHGRTRTGGGFIERVDSLNEHGGPNQEPVPPAAGPTTSRYVLSFSPGHGSWVPGVDLAPDDRAPVAPLAAVIPVTTYSDNVSAAPDASPGTDGNSSANGTAQEFTFDAADVQVVHGEGQPARQAAVPENNRMRWLNAWWVPVAILTLGGLLAIVWARRRAVAVREDRRR